MPDGLTVEDFAAAVKKKYPDYAEVDDYDLTHRYLNKHPDYKESVTFGPRERAYAAAARSGLSRDLADDFLNVTGGIESGNRHRTKGGQVLQSPPDPKTGERAIGFSQIKPSTIKPYGLDPYDEDQNIEGGLRYFSEGGQDPVARRIYYFGGPGALKRYQKTGRIPKGQDVTGTTFDKYVKATMPKVGVSPVGETRYGVSANRSAQTTPAVGADQSQDANLSAIPAAELDTSARRPRSVEDDPTKRPVGYLGEIRKQSPEFESKFYDFLQSNTPPTSKAKTVGQAANDQSMAWSFLKIVDFAQKNKDADQHTINKGLSQIGVEFLRNPETAGSQLPVALHDAMLAAKYTPEEWSIIPGKLQAQIRQYRTQVAVQRGREKQVTQLQKDVETLGPTVDDWLPDLDYHLRMDAREFQSLKTAQQRKVVNLVAQRVRDDQLRRQAGQTITEPSVEEEIEMRKSIGLPRRPVTPLNIGNVGTERALSRQPYQPKFEIPDRELRSEARQEILAERKERRPYGALSEAQTAAEKAFDLEQAVDSRVAEIKRAQEERQRLLPQFTPAEKQNVIDLTQQLTGHGTGIKRGVDIGVQGVTSGLIYKLAGAADAALAGGPNQWMADWLRKQALTGELSIESVRKLPSNKRQDVAEFVSSLAAALPEAVAATAVGGPVAGFAFLGASEAQGRNLGAGAVIKEGVKGALIGKVFDWSDLIAVSSAPASVTQTIKNVTKKALTVGAGTMAVELASGTPPKEALKAGLTNALLPVVMAPLHGKKPSAKDVAPESKADTVTRTSNQEIEDLVLRAQARDRAEQEAFTQEILRKRRERYAYPDQGRESIPPQSIVPTKVKEAKDARTGEILAEGRPAGEPYNAGAIREGDVAGGGEPPSVRPRSQSPEGQNAQTTEAQALPRVEDVVPEVEAARQRYIESSTKLFQIDTQLVDANRSGLTEAQVKDLHKQRNEPYTEALAAQRQLREQGYEVTPVGELRPVSPAAPLNEDAGSLKPRVSITTDAARNMGEKYYNKIAHKITARDASGNEIGSLVVTPNGFPIDVFVDSEHRRQGIATALYKEAERVTGKPIQQGSQIKEGQVFREGMERKKQGQAPQQPAVSSAAPFEKKRPPAKPEIVGTGTAQEPVAAAIASPSESESPVVYHSGTVPFEKMEVERTKVGSKGRGLYFALTPEATQVYEIAKRGRPSSENVHAARLEMKNPLDVTKPEAVSGFVDRLEGMTARDYEAAAGLSAKWGRATDADMLRKNVKSIVDAARARPEADYVYSIVQDNPNLTSLAKSLGYDGIIDRSESVVFDRSQIRPAASPPNRRALERDPTAEMMSEERRQEVREMIAKATPEDAQEMMRLFAASKAELKPDVARETSKKSPTGDTLITGERSDISLSQFVRKRGGIVPAEMYKGELDRLRARETGTTGLINQKAKQGNLKQTADIMMEAANEAGFRDKNGQPFTNPGDFLRAVERDVAGERTQARTGAEPDWDAEIRKHEAGQQDLVNDADARVNLLENETSGVIYDKIAEGKASEAELQQFREHAKAAGLSSRGTEDLIASASADRGEASFTAPAEAKRPAQQLGFTEEGLTQESAPPPKTTDQRERLAREEQERQATLNPEGAKALAKIAELKRRGLTVEDYARQPDLEGNLPSVKEVEALRAAESQGLGNRKNVQDGDSLNFGPGTMKAGEPLPEVKERKFGKRFVEDERIAQDIRDSIGTAKYYEPISDKVTVKDATRLINERGLPQALKDVRDETNALPFRVRVAMGEEAVLKLNQTYKRLKEAKSPEAEFVLDQATDVSEFLMDYGTRLGQGVQAFAMWAKLTPEGKLLTYKRAVDKARQKVNAEEVKEIVETINKEMTDAERIAELDKLFKRNKTATKVKSSFEKLFEAAKDGKLTDELFYDVVGDRLGLPKYDRATAQKITDLALEIEAAPEGMPRDAKVFELNKFIAQQKGFSPVDLPIGIYYGNILSGYNTHIVNAVDTAVNVVSELNGLAITNPRAAAKIYGGMLRGFVDGRLDALLALSQGRMVTDGKWLEVPRLMELAKFGQKGGVPIKTETRIGRATKAVAESKVAYPLNAYKYVTRLLAASDSVFFRTAKEARASLLAYRMAEAEGLKGDLFDSRVQQILGMDRAADFTAQAKREGYTGVEAQVRAKELRDLVRDKDLTSDAAEFAGEATYNHEPHGTLGYLSKKVGEASEKIKPLKLFVPFTRIVANVTNRGLNYTPWGLKRAFFGYSGEGPLTPEAKRLMITRSLLGMVGINTLAALQAADYLQIHGNGPSDREKRRQMQQAGWRPYSIQIGDTYISYLNTPIGLGLSVTGNMSDSQRYHELEQKDAATRGAYAVARLGSTIFSQSFLSGLSRLFNALSEQPSESVTAVKQVMGSTVAAATTPNLARDIQRLFDNKAYQSNTLMEDLIRNTPFAGLALKPQLNAFGEPVRLQRQRFLDVLSSDPAWRFVIEKGLRVPVPSKTTELTEGERISPDEYYDLLSKTGPRLKQWITENREKLGEMKEQDAQEEISKASTAITKDELDKIRKAKGMKRERVVTPPSKLTNPNPDKRRSVRPRRSREWQYPSEKRDERQRRYNVQPQP